MKSEYLLLAIVLVVGLAGLFSNNNATGTVVYIDQNHLSGEVQSNFGRPLGNRMEQFVGDRNYQCHQTSEGTLECCYLEQGKRVCATGNGKTFGPSREFRDGGQKAYLTSGSKPNITLG